MYLTIERKTNERYERWDFWVSTEYPQHNTINIVLNYYFVGSKTIKQRVYRTEGKYDRIDGRSNTIKEPPTPEDVIQEVKDKLKDIIVNSEVLC